MESIKKSTLDFLTELKCNNNRDWFIANRSRYLDAKDNFESFVQEIINKIILFEPVMKGLEAKSCVFRINRDIRFSNDKSLYKSHFGAFIVRGGKKNGDKFAGYYFHIEPGKSIMAGGAYTPPSQWLSAIREKISDTADEFIKITHTKDFIKYFGAIDGEKLKTAPKGYPANHPYIELLKFKSYLVVNEVPDKMVISNDFIDHVVNVFKAMKPLNDYLNN
jgi:TIGR02453 family protein